MTHEEIARNFKEAKFKKKQIEILADLNLMTKNQIIEILKEQGVDKRSFAFAKDARGAKPKKASNAAVKDSGERTEFATGAVRDMHSGKGRMDLLPWHGIMEVSKHCEDGAAKYGEHNVDKGIPLHSLLDSASRHLAKCIAGMDDEDHLRAATWNLLWALNQRTTHPGLNDMPWAERG